MALTAAGSGAFAQHFSHHPAGFHALGKGDTMIAIGGDDMIIFAQGVYDANAGGFFTVPEIELRDVASGSVVMSVTLPERPAAGFIDSLDVSDTHVLINIVEEGSVFPVATVVEIASGGLTVNAAPIGGIARFLRSAPDLDGVLSWP